MPQLFDYMTEDLVSENEAKELTRPYWSDMVDAWLLAWERWEGWNEDDRRRICETPTARPGVLNALTQSFAKDLFCNKENDGIVVCDAIPGVFAFYINNKVLVRFNGLGDDHVVRCDGASPLKMKYLSQEPIPKLNNSATRITVGYTLDPLKTALDSVEISLQLGRDSVFHFVIDEEAGGAQIFSPKTEEEPALILTTKKIS